MFVFFPEPLSLVVWLLHSLKLPKHEMTFSFWHPNRGDNRTFRESFNEFRNRISDDSRHKTSSLEQPNTGVSLSVLLIRTVSYCVCDITWKCLPKLKLPSSSLLHTWIQLTRKRKRRSWKFVKSLWNFWSNAITAEPLPKLKCSICQSKKVSPRVVLAGDANSLRIRVASNSSGKLDPPRLVQVHQLRSSHRSNCLPFPRRIQVSSVTSSVFLYIMKIYNFENTHLEEGWIQTPHKAAMPDSPLIISYLLSQKFS